LVHKLLYWQYTQSKPVRGRKVNKVLKNILFAFGVCAAMCPVANATVIDIPPPDTTSGIGPFGVPNYATFGETFTVGTDNVLNSFSLYVSQRITGNGALDLRGYVASWDGFKATNILYTSATVQKNASNDVQEFAFDTGNLALTSGSQYVAFLSVSELGPQDVNAFFMALGLLPYSGGNFVANANGTNFSSLTTVNWNSFQQFDVAFKATLSNAAEVPEPTTVALLGLGLLGFAASRRKSVNSKYA
jgi:hypothetical protein